MNMQEIRGSLEHWALGDAIRTALRNPTPHRYRSVGCYPLYYLDREDKVLCADCAGLRDWNQPFPDTVAANWEDRHLYCEECSAHIECAYPDDTEGGSP